MKLFYSAFNNFPGKFILIEGLNGSGKTTQAKILKNCLKRRGVKVIFNHEPTKSKIGQLIRFLIEKRIKTEKEEIFLKKLVKEIKKEKFFPKDLKEKLYFFLQKLTQLPFGQPLFLKELEKQTLFVADRLLDLHYHILPQLKKGNWIIQDRYDLSGYFHGLSQKVKISQLKKIHQQFLASFYLAPDLIFYYWLPPFKAFQRLKKSGKILDCYEEKRSLEKIEKIARNFFHFSPKIFSFQNSLLLYPQVKKRKIPLVIINAQLSIPQVTQETLSILERFFPQLKICSHRSVGIILKNDQGKILLIDRKIFPLYFACPAGHLEGKESPQEGIKREVKEETGLEVFNLKLVLKKKFKNPCSQINGSWHWWWVFQGDFKGRIKPSFSEVKKIGWFSLLQLKELIKKKKLEPVWQEIFQELQMI